MVVAHGIPDLHFILRSPHFRWHVLFGIFRTFQIPIRHDDPSSGIKDGFCFFQNAYSFLIAFQMVKGRKKNDNVSLCVNFVQIPHVDLGKTTGRKFFFRFLQETFGAVYSRIVNVWATFAQKAKKPS